MSNHNINFFINNQKVTANKNETIWEVDKKLEIDIPHLCYLPEPGYRTDGNCRACMVEIEGERVLSASCIRKPTKEMKIYTSSDRAKKSRELVFELLLSDQPIRETSHDPNSKFWQCCVQRSIYCCGGIGLVGLL